MNTAILEADSGLRHQILDRARNQDFTGTRFRGDAGADVKRKTNHVSPADFVFAGVQPYSDLQPQRAHGLADCSRATDTGSRRVERCEHPVPRGHDFLSAQNLQLFADGGVVVIHHLCPTRIAQPRGFFGRPDDIDNQYRGERLFELSVTLGRSTPDRNTSGQRFVAMALSPGNRGVCVIFGTLDRAATNCFHPWRKCPVDLSPVCHAKDLDGAPLQENRRTNPANPPCF